MNTSNLTVNNNNALSAFFAEQFANLTPWTVGMGQAPPKLALVVVMRL